MSIGIKVGVINRVMDVTITNDAYTFANVRTTNPVQLLTIKGERITYTPSSTPDKSIIDTIQENIPSSRVIYPECCSQLLSHLIQKREGVQRLLDISPHNCEFAIASHSIKKISYTGVDPRKELTDIINNTDVDTDRIVFVPTISDIGEEPYDIMIIDLKDISSIHRDKLKSDGILIVRGTEETRSSPTFGNCWSLPFTNIYGTIGIRNINGSCDAVFVVSGGRDSIDIPEPTNGKVHHLYKLPKSVIPKSPTKSMLSYSGKNIPCLGGHPYACLQETIGITTINNMGVVLKSSTYNPIEYLSLYTQGFINKVDKINLHIFEYDSKIPNRSYSYLNDSINLTIHTHSSYNKCITHAKYLIDDLRNIIGLGSDDDIISIVADGVIKVMGSEDKMLIEIRGVYDLLAKGVAKAYPRSDIRMNMSACDPSTLTYIQSTRDGSKIYATNTLGKKKPSMIIKPESVDYPIGDYTKTELVVLAETNLPHYERPGGDYVATSPNTSLPADYDIKTSPHVIPKGDSANRDDEPSPLHIIPNEEYFIVEGKNVDWDRSKE